MSLISRPRTAMQLCGVTIPTHFLASHEYLRPGLYCIANPSFSLLILSPFLLSRHLRKQYSADMCVFNYTNLTHCNDRQNHKMVETYLCRAAQLAGRRCPVGQRTNMFRRFSTSMRHICPSCNPAIRTSYSFHGREHLLPRG